MIEFVELVSVSVYWYCVLLDSAADGDVLPRLHEEFRAHDLGELWPQPLDDLLGGGRSPSGLSWMNMRSVFSLELPPVAPAKLTTQRGRVRNMIFEICSR